MYLLDTNAVIGLLYNPSILSKRAHDVMINNADALFVSMVTPWEITIKRSIGKIDVDDNASDILDLCDEYGLELLNITRNHVDELGKLPMIPRDPFDRLLIAQAISENMTIVTKDLIIPKYSVEVIW